MNCIMPAHLWILKEICHKSSYKMHPSNSSGSILNTRTSCHSKKQQHVVGDVLWQLVVFGLHYLSLWWINSTLSKYADKGVTMHWWHYYTVFLLETIHVRAAWNKEWGRNILARRGKTLLPSVKATLVSKHNARCMLLKGALKISSPVNFCERCGGKERISCHFIAATNDNTLCKATYSGTVDWGAKASAGCCSAKTAVGAKGRE